MEKEKQTSPLSNCENLGRKAVHVHTIYDTFGAVAAEYTFYPFVRVLYVRWHGHVTSDELIRAAQVGLKINQQLQPLGLVHDTRESSGDWGEASPWVTYEWIPGIKTKCASLRSIVFLLNAEAPMPYSNTQLIAELNEAFEIRTFYVPITAWRWLRRRTMPVW